MNENVTTAEKFKFPDIFLLLEQVEVSELKNDGSYKNVAAILRAKFPSLKDMEDLEWVIEIVSGNRRKRRFQDEFQQMIYQTFCEKDRSIMNEWKITKNKSTIRYAYVLGEKKKIYDRMHQRYKKIVAHAFGPVCAGCRDKSKFTFHINCECRLKGICKWTR